MEGKCYAVLGVFIALELAGCGRSTVKAPASPALSFEEALARVHERLPVSRYVDNSLLSSNEDQVPPVAGAPVTLRVGMPWVFNDEVAPWFVGIEKGFYRDAGLELQLVPGGPGIDPLQLLAGGKLDIAVPPAGVQLVELIASPTSADLVAIGTVLKSSPYCWLGLDKDTPRDQVSAKRLQPRDFIGKTLGLQPGTDYLLDYLSRNYQVPTDSLHVRRAGFTPEPLLTGSVDYYGAFIVNQPRILERDGYKNWVAFRLADWGWADFADVSVVRRDALAPRADVWRRYLRATGQALRFILDHPDEAAEITARRSTDVPLTPAMVRRRFDLQRDMMLGKKETPLQQMLPEDWDKLAANLLQSGSIDLSKLASAGKPPTP